MSKLEILIAAILFVAIFVFVYSTSYLISTVAHHGLKEVATSIWEGPKKNNVPR